jgi:predicted CXXCH cytochrome family protein
MFARFERLTIALIFALLAAGGTLIVANAQDATPPVTGAQANEQPCAVCHTDFQMIWQSGLHGQAGDDPVFIKSWEDQGKPGACLVCHVTGYDPATATWTADGVTCESCHGPANPNHPAEPMEVDRSPDLCGRCHSDTRFGWQDWQGSTHYQRGMSCSVCHDPHSASLKEIPVAENTTALKDASQLCINCHKEVSMEFPYSQHHEQGVSCVQCHVEHLEDQTREPHSMPDHSFQASLQTCNTCHADQMHSATSEASIPTGEGVTPVEVTESTPTEEAVQSTPVTSEPSPVSPIGYAGLAGLVGLAAGMVLAPWLERFYHRVSKHQHEEEHHE